MKPSVRVDQISYGNLMMMVNGRDRWVYKGSVTTPPCDTFVYWNVLKTVYPINSRTLKQFKDQLERVSGLDVTGNWREIQPVDNQNPVLIQKEVDSDIANIILSILFMTTCCLFCVLSVHFWQKTNFYKATIEQAIATSSNEGGKTERELIKI